MAEHFAGDQPLGDGVEGWTKTVLVPFMEAGAPPKNILDCCG